MIFNYEIEMMSILKKKNEKNEDKPDNEEYFFVNSLEIEMNNLQQNDNDDGDDDDYLHVEFVYGSGKFKKK